MRRRRIGYSTNTECNHIEIEMIQQFTELNNESEDGDTVLSFSHSMFKLNDFIKSVKKAFQENGLHVLHNKLSSKGGIPLRSEHDKWYQQGIDCELLKPGTKRWNKGKLRIKISLEFSPDEPGIEEIPVNLQINTNQSESPLDDIRKAMNQDS